MFGIFGNSEEKASKERIERRTKELELEKEKLRVAQELQNIEEEKKMREKGYKKNQTTGEWVFCGPIIDIARRSGYDSVSEYIISIGGFQNYKGLCLNINGVLTPNYC